LHTLFLLCLALFIRPSIYASLQYLVLALELVLVLVFKLLGLVLVNVHGALAIFDGFQLLLGGLRGSLGHVES
jgi:hypothetical protein